MEDSWNFDTYVGNRYHFHLSERLFLFPGAPQEVPIGPKTLAPIPMLPLSAISVLLGGGYSVFTLIVLIQIPATQKKVPTGASVAPNVSNF